MQVHLPLAKPEEENPQRRRVKRGQQAEEMVREAIKRTSPNWIHKMIAGGDGTPFDYLVTYKGGLHLGIEVKHLHAYRLSRSMFTPAEIEGLSGYGGGNCHAVVVAVVTTPTRQGAYIVPWSALEQNETVDPSAYEWIPRKGCRLYIGDYIDTLRRGITYEDHRSRGDYHIQPHARACGVGA